MKILNTTAGSPYYTPHLQRPAAFPPSDGYQPFADPLIDVAQQMRVVCEVKAQAPAGMLVIGSGYTYLQEFVPLDAQAIVREGWADAVGIGRMVLSYSTMLADAIAGRAMEKKFICRTFSECTTEPRNGIISGCYPLDKFYTQRPEFTAWPNWANLEPFIWHVGNLTILGKRINNKAQNKSFADKCNDHYSKSVIKMTKDLLKETSWDEIVIRKRAKDLAKIAIQIWK